MADGYEIRFGEVRGPAPAVAQASTRPVAWAQGNVLATTVHGLFEIPEIVEAVLGQRPSPVLEGTFDLLADAVDERLDGALLAAVLPG